MSEAALIKHNMVDAYKEGTLSKRELIKYLLKLGIDIFEAIETADKSIRGAPGLANLLAT